MDRSAYVGPPMYGEMSNPYANSIMHWNSPPPPSPRMIYGGMPMPAPPSAYPSFAAPPPLSSQPRAFASTSQLPPIRHALSPPPPPLPLPTRALEPEPAPAPPPKPKAATKKAAPAPKAAKRKRQRVMHSCLPCHQLKRKCDRGRPCGRCVSLSMTGDCVYETEDPAATHAFNPTAPDAEHTRLRNRISELEAVVRSLKDRSRGAARGRRGTSGSSKRARHDSYGSDGEGEGEDDYAAFEDGTERFSSPPGSGSHDTSLGLDIDRKPTREEIEAVTMPPTPGHIPHDHYQPSVLEPETARASFYFVGAGAAPLMVKQLNSDLGSAVVPETAFVELCPRPPSDSLSLDWRGPTGRPAAIRHITDKLVLTAAEADALFAAFVERIDCLHHAWHTPLLEHKWRAFFARPAGQRHHADEATLALVLAVLALCYLAVVAPTPDDCRRAKVDEYMIEARCVLHVIGADTNPSIETIQAKICIGIACLETGRAGLWAIELPSVVRQAQMIGLHVDPSKLFSEQPWTEQEIRRRIWWTLQAHDASFASLTGMPTSSPFNDCDQPQDRSETSLTGPNVTNETVKLPASAVEPISFHIYRFELALYTRDFADKIFHRYGWQWSKVAPEAAVPDYTAIELTHGAIQKWISLTPPGLRYMVDQRDFVEFPEPLDGTTELDVRERRSSLVAQTLTLCIATHDMLLNLHRPYLQLIPVHDARDAKPVHPNSLSIEQCFYSAHTIVKARALLHELVPDLATPFWVNLHTYHAALTLAYFALRLPNLFHAQYAIQDIKLLAKIFKDMSAPHQPTVDCLSQSLAAIEHALPAQPKTSNFVPPFQGAAATHPIGTFPLPPQPPPLVRSPSAGLHSPGLQKTPSLNAADLKLAPILNTHHHHYRSAMPAVPTLHGPLRNSFIHPTSADRGGEHDTPPSREDHVPYHRHAPYHH